MLSKMVSSKTKLKRTILTQKVAEFGNFKVGCVFPMFISSELRMEQYRNEHLKNASLFCKKGYFTRFSEKQCVRTVLHVVFAYSF